MPMEPDLGTYLAPAFATQVMQVTDVTIVGKVLMETIVITVKMITSKKVRCVSRENVRLWVHTTEQKMVCALVRENFKERDVMNVLLVLLELNVIFVMLDTTKHLVTSA